MNRQMDAGFHARFGAKISNIRNTRCASFLIRLCARPGSIPIALIALFLITTSASTMFSPVRTVSATTETIVTVAADYTTPKASWNLGETSHARVDGEPLPSGSVPYVRRVIWVAPDGSVAQIHPLDTDPDTDDYSIPSSGAFAQVGTWTVKTIDNRGVGHASATFTVLSTTAANVDLSITKSGPALANAGDSVTYTLTITNNGPDAAQNVEIRDAVPANTTFVSESQTGGPAATCGNQVIDDVTTSVCTISSLDANATASFTLVYTIDSTVGNGTVIFNGATVTSSTNEINSQDNQASFNTLVSSTPPPPPCIINCPSNVTVDNDANQCSAVVTYVTPTTSGNCADETGSVPPVVCSPPSGSTFPTGSTSVTCASGGNACAFTVTVHDTRPPVLPTISCPGNVTADEDSAGSGSAIVNYAAPTTTGNCVNTTCFPPSGASFSVGTVTVNCTATDSSNNLVSCSFTVTVNSTSGPGCTITCPGDITQAAPTGQCSAVVSYSSPTTSGPCGTVTCVPPPGAFPVGTTVVTCTANGGPSCNFTVTVTGATGPPTIVTCASNKAVPVDVNCEGVIPNLLGEVVVTGCNVIKSQSPAAGSVVPSGNYTVTITAENAAGVATCTANVRVDNAAPVISCPGDVNADFDPAVNGAVVTYTTPVGTDNCPGATTTQIAGLPSGSTFPAGTTTNTFSVTDAVGNTAQCSFNVTVAITSIIGLDSVSISGSGLVDSYNSAGGYPATQGSLVNVLSNGTITLGNSGKVMGNVRSTRAGVAMSGASQVTGNATAGTTVSRSGSATVGGTITNNQLAPVMTLPSVAACSPYSSNSGISGTFSYNQSTGDLTLSGVNIATLANGNYCFHNITLTNSAQLKVNGLVVIKLTGTLSASGATSFTNTTGIPGSLRILSSYTGTTGVTLSNGTNLSLVIYAPGTGVSISGSAPLFGTVVGKTVTIGNSGMVHYDTQLKSIWPEIWSLLP